MKYFIAIALIATVASAAITKPTGWAREIDEIQQIIDAINSPSTNPATAAALQDMLLDVLGVNPEPVAVGPAVIESEHEPVSVGPAFVEAEYEPVSVGPALVDFPVPIAPAPVADVSASSAPLVQIIVNIANQVAAESPIAVAPIVVPEADKPEPIQVVESAPEPIQVVEVAPEPIQVIETAPEPIQVVETAPVVIGTPVLPSPAVVLPEPLN